MKLYTLATCDSCRKATRWLRDHGIEFQEIAIRETPPSLAELRTMLEAYDGEIRRLFNTSGRDYRAEGLGEKLPKLSTAAALALLQGNGNLVKRPFAIGDGVALVGFDADEWTTRIDARKSKH